MNLEDVFKQSGVPEVTFVAPPRYEGLRVSLRTPGRCSVIEGPSGIGKTTSVMRLIEELALQDKVVLLSARRPSDIEYIESLPDLGDIGIAIIDDFHRLPEKIKKTVSDFVKVLADQGSLESKVVLIGINKAGDRLVQFGADVGLRLDVFKFESNPQEKILELIGKGEAALNIDIKEKDVICEVSQGSFQIAQMLCHQVCLSSGITITQETQRTVENQYLTVIDQVGIDLRRIFFPPCMEFARGSKLRPEGRAPYLHILKWLRDSNEWSVTIRDMIRQQPEHRSSVGQVVDKGFLDRVLSEKADILSEHFHYDKDSTVFSTEDPRLIFFLKMINWGNFAREVGFTTDFFERQYDIALSFAGQDRDIAESIFSKLSEREVSVFYDKNEQHRIIAMDVEKYLVPIYESDASYVVPILSESFPQRIWTKIESDAFRSRFGDNAVIPIRSEDTRDGFFSEAQMYGSLSFSRSKNLEPQVELIVETIAARLKEDKGENGL